MRFLAVLFVLAMVLVVSAAPKNVPQYDPQAAAEFNSQQSSKRSLQDAVHQWLNPDKVPIRILVPSISSPYALFHPFFVPLHLNPFFSAYSLVRC